MEKCIPIASDKSSLLSYTPQLLKILENPKSVSDYLTLSELYRRMGEPEKEIEMIEKAFTKDSNDPRLLLVIAKSQFSAGQKKEARKLFSQYLSETRVGYRWWEKPYSSFYFASMAYPGPSLALLFLFSAFSFFLFLKKFVASVPLRKWSLLGLLSLQLLLSVEFFSTGSVYHLALLLLAALVPIGLVVWSQFLSPLFAPIKHWIAALLNGIRFVSQISSIPLKVRVPLAIASLFALVTLVPLIPQIKLRFGLSMILVLVFYGLLSSFLISFFRTSHSLQISMKWIGISATFPFLISYFISHWEDLGSPLLLAQLPSSQSLRDLGIYISFWLSSALLGIHMSKILAHALIEPLKDILKSLQLVREGNFNIELLPQSQDEMGTVALAVNNMAEGLKSREEMKKTFSRYVDDKVASEILSQENHGELISGQEFKAAVLFSDLRGFTQLSETVTPSELVTLLNLYFGKMVNVIKAHDGVIDKFIGDAMLCVWGIPKPIPECTRQAVKCALEMQSELIKVKEELKQRGLPPIEMGIGINFGTLVAGSIGSQDRMEYTVLGDVVNTAQRIESQAKQQQILIGESVWLEVKEQFKAVAVGELTLKGKEKPLRVWEVRGSLPGEA